MSDTPLTDKTTWKLWAREYCEAKVSRRLERDRAALMNALDLFLSHVEEPECSIWRHVVDVAHAAMNQASEEI